MADFSSSLNPPEAEHARLMRALAVKVADTALVLKGGTALMLCYGLDRFSTDLDFDSTKKLGLESRIHAALPPGTQVLALDKLKDTDTVTRYRLTYQTLAGIGKLKIEISHRDPPQADKVVIINGIKTYTAARLLAQKLEAMENRTAPRDLYDIAFLAAKFPASLSGTSATRFCRLTEDMASVEARYRAPFADDPVLSTVDFDGLLCQILCARNQLAPARMIPALFQESQAVDV